MKRLSSQSAGRAIRFVARAILFAVALAILVYEFIIGPKHGQRPESTIVISAIALAAASISLKWDWRP
jgi:hypothetical protein